MTGRDRESGLQLYVHRKGQSKVEGRHQESLTKNRRGWNEGQLKDQTDSLNLERYNLIGVQSKGNLEGSLIPVERTKRGLSILNKEKNNFVRDVSERVKRNPLGRLKDIRLYQAEKEETIKGEYQFGSETKPIPVREKSQKREKSSSKSGEIKNKKKKILEGFKSERNRDRKKDFMSQAPDKKKPSLANLENGHQAPKTPKAGTLKHLKRRGTKKKKRDISSKKKSEKVSGEKRRTEKNHKKKNHQTSLSTKIERELDGGRLKKSSMQNIDEKKTKKKKSRKVSDSTTKALKKRRKEGKSTKHSKNNKKMFASNEAFLNSLYSDKNELLLLKESADPRRKKRSKKNKSNLKSSNEERSKNKLFKPTKKKSKQNPKEMISNERKRYMSVNTAKNPLLESDFGAHISPRKTLNLKHEKFKRGNSYKSNDIQKTELFSYRFKKELESGLSPNGLKKTDSLYLRKNQKNGQATLYQRNQSQGSSENEDIKQGVYKNLYSGRHEKNILEFSSKQKENNFKQKTKHKIEKEQKLDQENYSNDSSGQ